MTRTLVKPKDIWERAHPKPVCKGWKKLIKDGYVSYTWDASGIPPRRRDYQIFMGVWQSIEYCPFCSLPINRGSPLYFQPEDEKDKAKALKALKRDME